MKLANTAIRQKNVAREMLIMVWSSFDLRSAVTIAFAGACGCRPSELSATLKPDDLSGSTLAFVVSNECQGNPFTGVEQIERSFQIKHRTNMLRISEREKDRLMPVDGIVSLFLKKVKKYLPFCLVESK